MIKTAVSALKQVKGFYKDESGDILQVGIVMGILAVIAVGALVFLGPKIKSMFSHTGAQLDKAQQVTY